MLHNNRVIAYSLLAHVNDHSSGISDLADIFLPLIKRTLCMLHRGGAAGALVTDLKTHVDRAYNFDMPIPMLRMILKRIQVEVNTREEKRLVLHQDDSFSLSGFAFTEFEETVRIQEAAIGRVNAIYEDYLRTNGRKVEDEPSIFEFLDQNRLELSGAFAHGAIRADQPSFAIQAEFVTSVMRDEATFHTLRRVYMGSIITSYLELDIREVGHSNIELVFDTDFVVSLLGLHSEESEHTCKQVVEIAKRLGYKSSVLSITVNETNALLRRVAEGLNSSFFTCSIDTDSIEAACARQELKKTDLQRIATNLVACLKDGFGVSVVDISNEFVERAKSTDLYHRMQERPHNPQGAPHDAFAYHYVREKRGGTVRQFSAANCWFVADSRHGKRFSTDHQGLLGERILADHLVNVLWLSNPRALSQEIGVTGLTRLVATTVRDSLPSPAVLHELDENIRKYAVWKVSASDLVAVAHSSACKTDENLRRLNQSAKESPDELCATLRELARKEKERQREEKQAKENRIEALEANLAEQAEAAERARSIAAAALKSEVEGQLTETQKDTDALSRIREALQRESKRAVNLRMCAILAIIILPPLVCFGVAIKVWWNRMEGLISFLLFVPTALGLLYFALTKQVFSPVQSHKNAVDRAMKRSLEKHDFDEERYQDLLQRKTKLQERLSQLNGNPEPSA